MSDKPFINTFFRPYGSERQALETPRTPRARQEPGFLDSLRMRGEVMEVQSDWKLAVDKLPEDIRWVLHPNGDLERIR